jgi:hypothetical protein
VKRQLRALEDRIFSNSGPNSTVLGPTSESAKQRIDERLRMVENAVLRYESEGGSLEEDTTEEEREGDPARRKAVEKVRGLEGVVRGLEEKLRADGGRMERRIAEMLKRMEMLEEALRSEQETSLKALEAILAE